MQKEQWNVLYGILKRYKTIVGCVDCGRTTGLLDYDHEGTEDIKKFGLSLGLSHTPTEVWQEFDKTVVRCRSCHMKRHAADPVWREKIGSKHRGRKHGPMPEEQKRHLSTVMKGRLFR